MTNKELLKKLQEDMELRRIFKIHKVHSLRHSFATKLVEEGVPLVQVKELLGHSCIRSTMTYVHVANNNQKVKSPLDIYII